jgi:plastocyanin
MTCTASGTAAEGQYTNLGTASGTPPGGLSDVSDSDPSHYFGVSAPQPEVDLEKSTFGLDADTAPGPSVPVGVEVTWSYTVTNPGDITLFDLEVIDDNGTPGDTGDDFPVCDIPSLDPDASHTCSATGTTIAGQYTNLGTMTGTYPGAAADVSDSDPSHYFGVAAAQPAIDLEKDTNGFDADAATGPFVPVGSPITWTYTFTNTGDVTLFDVTVMDDNGTPSESDDDWVVCTFDYLDPDGSDSCAIEATASAGQYTNIGMVSGFAAGATSAVSDSDPSNYFGVQASITLEKLTNDVDADTAPGPSIPVGQTVTWTYTASNTGNVTLSGVVVTDDNGTPSDPSDDQTVCTISSLNPDESDSCSASGTAVEGQYTNVGSVTGSPPGGLPDVSASDSSNYFGVLESQPALALQKSTNGQDADTAPGPSVLVGETVTWTYSVRNSGNVTLFNVVVSDDNGTPADDNDDFTVCTIASLDPGGSETCSAEGTATEGQYANLGTATGSPQGDLPEVSASDPSHYFGVLPEPQIELQKSTNGFDADSAPGPTLYVGYNLSWEFTVSNPGDEPITDVTITDDNGTPGDESDDVTVCTLESLAPLTSHTCTINGTVQEGQYANVGTVSGYINERMVSALDPSHYFGEFPKLYLPVIYR